MFCFFHRLCTEAAAVGPAHIPATQLVDGRCISAQFFSLIGRAPVLRLLHHVPLHEPPPDGAVGAGRLDVELLDQPERLRHEQRHPKGQQGGHEGFQGRLLCLEGDLELGRSGTLAEAGSERILAAFSLGAVAFLGCPKGHSALVQTLHVFQTHVYGLLMFMFSREVHPSKKIHGGSSRMLFLFQAAPAAFNPFPEYCCHLCL